MTQIILNIESPSVARDIRNLLKNIAGVHVLPNPRKKKTGLEEALEDVKAGRVKAFASVDDLMKDLLD